MSLEPAVLSALASPRRQEILRLTWEGERSAGEIHRAMADVTAVSFGAISLQLRVLRQAGLVDVRADHRHRFYKARQAALGPLAQTLERMWDDALWRLKLVSELEDTRRGPRPAGARRTQRRRSRR
jgi:DNA-binding transcriptional ArsR family regulator